MKLEKAVKRERKHRRNKWGHVVDSKSVFTIVETQKNRAKKIKQERKRKEALLEIDS